MTIAVNRLKMTVPIQPTKNNNIGPNVSDVVCWQGSRHRKSSLNTRALQASRGTMQFPEIIQHIINYNNIGRQCCLRCVQRVRQNFISFTQTNNAFNKHPFAGHLTVIT